MRLLSPHLTNPLASLLVSNPALTAQAMIDFPRELITEIPQSDRLKEPSGACFSELCGPSHVHIHVLTGKTHSEVPSLNLRASKVGCPRPGASSPSWKNDCHHNSVHQPGGKSFKVHRSRSVRQAKVIPDGKNLVSHAGAAILAELADRRGLTEAMSVAMNDCGINWL